MYTVDRYVSVHYVSTCSYGLIDDNFEFTLVLLTKLDEKDKDSHHIASIIFPQILQGSLFKGWLGLILSFHIVTALKQKCFLREHHYQTKL